MYSKESCSSDYEIPNVLIEQLKKTNGEPQTRTYIRGQMLGRGGFAKVYEMTVQDTKETVACKMIPKERVNKARAKQKLMSEIKIHKHLKHENIVQFLHHFEDEDNLYIFLELCKNHSLREVLKRRKRLTELETQSYMYSIINGILYLHAHRIIHRDIKLANIFISDKMEVKIGDFGLAAKLEFEGERKKTICGTPNYIAPEILEGKSGHSYECDIWSLGVVLYTLLIGRPPYETKDVKLTYRRIKMNLYNFPEKVRISEEAKSLISSILVLDFLKRPSLSSLLSHEFFTKNTVPKLLPQSCLSIPPSQHFLQRYESAKVSLPTRASSQENKLESSTPTSPKRLRPLSKDSKRVSDPRKDVKLSNYAGSDDLGPEVWVISWIDYSRKYGLGYLMSNSSVGAIFNDDTHIMAEPGFINLRYISGEQVFNYKIDEYPSDLYKKVMLLHLFKKLFGMPEKSFNFRNSSSSSLIFLKKWSAAPHAYVFRITNKIVQICFRDGTELLLCTESKRVTYVNKVLKVVSCPLNEVMDSGNKEMTKRIKYSKEVLLKMLKNE